MSSAALLVLLYPPSAPPAHKLTLLNDRIWYVLGLLLYTVILRRDRQLGNP